MAKASKLWIDEWHSGDDRTFWEKARQKGGLSGTFAISILAENIGFSIWLIWSVVAARLEASRLPLHDDQPSLVAIPGLVGALMRFPYTFAVPKFGVVTGR